MINNYVADIVAGLGDPLGEYLEIITIALIVAAAVFLTIGIISIIKRK